MANYRAQSRKAWELSALTKLKTSGKIGARAVQYIADNKVKLAFAKQTTGAKWTLQGMTIGPPIIEINSKQAQAVLSGADAWSISLIAHEAKHYEQGLLKALSVYGELEAWQLQMKVLRELGAPPTHAALLAIEKLKLSHDEKTLKQAARLMKKYDPGYQIDLLPLNPGGLDSVTNLFRSVVGSPKAPPMKPASKVTNKKSPR